MLKTKERQQLKGLVSSRDTIMSSVFNTLGDTTRFTIFQILVKRKDACVSDIADIVGITVPAASHHLKILEMNGLARKERMGQMICYRVRDDKPLIKSIIKLIKN